ncbi:hypothetical protein FD47_GL001335 [Lentilactobacillus parafarraginis DSM 18390 = JCM 14109]|uniref:Uncharacterized protein n=1 Tax=Lentilactobacillus parafarraginis DSM 18390 = JCM 14109 TaxID=1423786 RepID=A0A0R1Z3B5_9LACO|nr:hypothetical protein FD47_GL001335 [Lentilactobacillus parafarraginis DSM 18390 = JCM 14109]
MIIDFNFNVRILMVQISFSKFSIQLSNNAGMTLMTIGEQRSLFPNGREIHLN